MFSWAANSELWLLLVVLGALILELVHTKQVIRRRREKEGAGQKKV